MNFINDKNNITMGFGKNLAKGFVRSAVNQVGRDGGKVISNQLYGDAHSSPHRSVNGSCGQPQLGILEEKYLRTERASIPSNARVAFCVLLALMFNLFGALVLLISGYSRWKSRYTIKGWNVYSVPTYAPDNRYRDGVRYEGDVMRREPVVLEADEWEVERNTIVARIYLAAGVCIILFLIAVMNFAK